MKTRFIVTIGILIQILLCLTVDGQDLSKYYTSRTQEGGNLYYIFPFEEFRNSGDHSSFVFDITFRQGHDSVTVNYTFYSDDPVTPDSLSFRSGDTVYSISTDKIYQDFNKGKWENRFSFKLAFGDFQKIITGEQVPLIRLVAKNLNLEYSIKEKKWVEYADALDKILYIIKSEEEKN